MVKNVTRHAWPGRGLDRLAQDVGFAFRLLQRNPGFALTAVLTLALGISANTTVFTIVDHVLFRPPPYLAGDRLVQVAGLDRPGGSGGNTLNAHRILGWQVQDVFERLEGFGPQQFDVSGDGPPERVSGYAVTTGLFSMLGVSPEIGRVFGPTDGRPGDEPVVILGHNVWVRRFGASANAIGARLRLNDELYRVVGVMPPHFLNRDDGVLVPFDLVSHDGDDAVSNFIGLGRLREGVTAAAAQERADALAAGLNALDPQPRSWYLGVRQWKLVFLSDLAHDALLMVLGAVGFVLLIGCANVANLLLSRAVVREREMAVRSALGASRGRLIRQGLTECSIVVLAGSALGVAFAWAGVRALVAVLPGATFIDVGGVDLRVDGRVLAFAAGATALTAAACGLVPAFRASRPSLDAGLRGVTSGTSRSTGRMSGLLVVVEVAFSIVLLVGAALLIRTFTRLSAIEPGFDPNGVVTANIDLPTDRYPTPAAREAFFEELNGALLRAGIVSTAIANGALPDETAIEFGTVENDDEPVRRVEPDPYVGSLTVGGAFFETLRIPIVEGRAFTSADGSDAVIVNQTLALRLWPAGAAVGRRMREGDGPWWTVVGVARDVEMRMFASNDRLTLQTYHPFVTRVASPPTPPPGGRRTFANRRIFVRAADAIATARTLSQAVWTLDPALPVQRTESLRDRWNRTFAPQLLVVSVMALFSLVAVVLAAAGLFAVISHAVARRTHEIGIRAALGATRTDIFRLVMSRGLALAAFGVVIGLAGAAAVSRTLTALLYQVGPYDAASFLAVAGGLLTVAAAACWLPTRRAMAVDPATALRAE
ncbi:MAG TPA: ABC transporter permease [Vicinamibacterales bacterium]|nr:ABC transporter permease [Vicinamibacterales bacterium]